MIKAMMRALGALALCAAAPTMAQSRMDATLESAARCELEKPMTPEVAAFRLLQSAHVVSREPLGSLVVYMGALDPKTGVNLFNMNPTRWAVITRSGQPDAMVGALYSGDSPITDSSILGSYQGGLKRKIDLTAFTTPTLAKSGVQSAHVSATPTRGRNHLMLAKLKGGDRLLVCASLDQIQRFVR